MSYASPPSTRAKNGRKAAASEVMRDGKKIKPTRFVANTDEVDEDDEVDK